MESYREGKAGGGCGICVRAKSLRVRAGAYARAGYLTVEAAMLSPLLISSVLMLMYMSAHLHNRTCLKASAAEQAISGHVQENPSLFALRVSDCQRTDENDRRCIKYKAGTIYLNGDVWSDIEEEAEYKKYRPVKQMRTIDAGKQIISGIW